MIQHKLLHLTLFQVGKKKDFPEQQQVFIIELNYKKESHIIFSIKSCDENSVTYTYVQPEEKAGQSITFSISIEE